MKTSFFLKRTRYDNRANMVVLLLFFIVLFFITLYTKGFNIGLLIFIILGAGSLFCEFVNYRVSGIYINGKDIIYKTVFLKKK